MNRIFCVQLNTGKNKIIIKAIDLAGNEKTEELIITKEKKAEKFIPFLSFWVVIIILVIFCLKRKKKSSL